MLANLTILAHAAHYATEGAARTIGYRLEAAGQRLQDAGSASRLRDFQAMKALVAAGRAPWQ